MPSPAVRQGLRGLALRVLEAHDVGGPVEAVLTGDHEVRRLNRSFRDRDEVTDVLSFAYLEGGTIAVGDGESSGPTGEIYISVERAVAQAEERGEDPQQELERLLVHGLLHLAGYVHGTESELQSMERETERLLALAG